MLVVHDTSIFRRDNEFAHQVVARILLALFNDFRDVYVVLKSRIHDIVGHVFGIIGTIDHGVTPMLQLVIVAFGGSEHFTNQGHR